MDDEWLRRIALAVAEGLVTRRSPVIRLPVNLPDGGKTTVYLYVDQVN